MLPGQSPGPEDDTSVDVFFPDVGVQFPIAMVLQGGLVAGSSYSQFGAELARFGFVVAIPNRLTLLGPPPPVPFPDELVVLEVLAQLVIENADPGSALNGRIDTERMGLVGHSVGGFVGLLVIEGSCVPPFCFPPFPFVTPDALQAGAFYGTNSVDPFTGQLIDVDTDDMPVALVNGSLDSIGTVDEAQATLGILDGPRELIIINGANHYGVTNVNNPSGAEEDDSDPTISQTESIQQISQAMGRFFRSTVATCVNANSLLSEANTCTVLPLTSARVEITGGSAGGVIGDVCLGPSNELKISGNQSVDGSILLSPGATVSQTGSAVIGGTIEQVDLSQEINAALAAAQLAAAMPCTQTFDRLENTQTIFGDGGSNVICVDRIEVKGNDTLTLSGGPDDSFIVNVTDRLEADDGGRIVAAGDVESKDVLYNILGEGRAKLKDGGSVDGTILATEGRIEIDAGLVNGQIFAGDRIEIDDGGNVLCPSIRP